MSCDSTPQSSFDTLTRQFQSWPKLTAAERGEVVASLSTELRAAAVFALHQEPEGRDLQPTIIVNELYIRMVKLTRIEFNSRSHFLGIAGKVMRQILVDVARRERAEKRGRHLLTTVTIDSIADERSMQPTDVLDLERALDELSALDPEYTDIVEARVFGGATIKETAQYLSLSESTVTRKWRAASAWLIDRMNKPTTP